MSLKAFHIFFIAVSILLAFGFGVWGMYYHLTYGNVWYLVMGIASLLVGVVLILYGINFLRKLKHTSYL